MKTNLRFSTSILMEVTSTMENNMQKNNLIEKSYLQYRVANVANVGFLKALVLLFTVPRTSCEKISCNSYNIYNNIIILLLYSTVFTTKYPRSTLHSFSSTYRAFKMLHLLHLLHFSYIAYTILTIILLYNNLRFEVIA